MRNHKYVRTHGRNPNRKVVGGWAFQESISREAFEDQLVGVVVWVPASTLAEAKRWMQGHGYRGMWAVMP
jgi:hypothetical protein